METEGMASEEAVVEEIGDGELESEEIEGGELEEGELEETEENADESFAEWQARQGKSDAEPKEGTKKESKEKPKEGEKESEDGDSEEATEEGSEDSKGDEDDDVSGDGDKQAPTIRFKVDGEEREVSHEQAAQLLSKAGAADDRMREAAHMKKQIGEFIEMLKNDPAEGLKMFKIDPDKFSEDRVYKRIQHEDENGKDTWDKHQENEEKDRRLKEYEDKEAKANEEREEAERKEQQDQETQKQQKIFHDKFTTALNGVGLVVNQTTMSRMGTYMRNAFNQGYRDIDPAMIAKQVKADLDKDMDEIRKVKVKEFEQKEKTTQKPRLVKKSRAAKKKRITSIYDMLE